MDTYAPLVADLKLALAAPVALAALLLCLAPLLRWGIPPLLRACRCCGQEGLDARGGAKALARVRGDDEFRTLRHEFQWTQGSMPSARSGYTLHTQTWTAAATKEPPRARGLLILLHGLYSHVGEVFFTSDYKIEGSMLERYLGMGFVVCAVDHQSMGQSEPRSSRRQW